MVKIEFSNDGQPAINDTNLNQMQDNIANATKTQIISATMTSNFTKTGTGYEQLVLNSSVSNGSLLTLSSGGGITIGAGITKVKVSARAYFSTITAGQKWLSIYKNSTATIASTQTLTGRSSIVVEPQLISVVQGDVISLRVNGADADEVRGGATYTVLTVEATIE